MGKKIDERKFNGGFLTIPKKEIGITIKVPTDELFIKNLVDLTNIVDPKQNEIRKALHNKLKVLYMHDIGIIDYVNEEYNLKYNWNKIGRLLYVFTDMDATSIAKALAIIKKSNELESKTKINIVEKRKRLWEIHKRTMNRMLEIEENDNLLVIKSDTIKKGQKVFVEEESLEDINEFVEISVFDQDINKSDVIKYTIYFIERIGITDFLAQKYGYEDEPEKIGKILSVFTNLKANSIARTMKDVDKGFIIDKKTKKEKQNKNFISGDVDEWVLEVCNQLEIKPVKNVEKPISPLKRKK